MLVKIGLKNGELHIANKYALILFIEQSGGFVEGELTKPKTKRTNQQNKFYWGVVIPLVNNIFFDYWGERLTPEETHEYLKSSCLPSKVLDINGEMVAIGGSSKELSKQEFTDYLTRIKTFIYDNFYTILQLDYEE